MLHLRWYIVLSFLGPAFVLAFQHIQWECGENKSCVGEWSGLDAFHSSQKNYTLSIKKQRFHLKLKEMQGEDFLLESEHFFLSAPSALFLYDSNDRAWTFPEGLVGKFENFYWEADQALYFQKSHTVVAQDVQVLLVTTGFVGQAEDLEYSEDRIFLKNIEISQCSQKNPSWSLKAESLLYTGDDDLLVIRSPKIFFYDYQILSFEEFRFEKNQARHALRGVPSFSLATGSGLTLKNPRLWTYDDHKIEITPQINSKNGIGADLKIEKNNFFAEGFVQFGIFSDHQPLSWLAKTAYSEKTGRVYFGYDAALVSDDQFYYRYPFLVSFWRDRYLPSRAWIDQKTDYGQFRIFSEKLQRTAQSKNTDTQVSEYLFQAQWTSNHKGSQSAGFDVIHRDDDEIYHRVKTCNSWFLGNQIDFSHGFSFYTREQAFNGFMHAHVPLYSLSTPIGDYHWFYVGQKSLRYGPQLGLDVIAQPITRDFLYNAHKHHGLDWSDDAHWVVSQWNIATNSIFDIETAIAWTWFSIDPPWEAPNQPYLTPFRDDDVFSPFSLRIFNAAVDFATLIDFKRSEIVYFAASAPVYRDSEQSVLVTSLYHKYYPSNALSTDVSKVAQIQFGYSYRPPQSWFFESSQRYDLIQMQLEEADLSFGYEDCCWLARWQIDASKQYNPENGQIEWRYKAGMQFEFKSSGLYRAAGT